MFKIIFKSIVSLCFISPPAYGIWGDMGGSWAQIPYLVKILDENHKRYQQLKLMMDQAKMSDSYLRTVHQGLENVTGILNSLPIKDQGVLSEIRNFNQSIKTIYQIYGQIPKSKEEVLHRLHDQTVAESLRMVNSFKDYSQSQESNSASLKRQSQIASPKGAARATAVSNALILESINQLIRLQSQSLKMQSELLAMKNKRHKASVTSYQEVDKHFGSAFKNLKRQTEFIKF